MWLHDGKQHTFPVSTPEDNFEPSAKARLEKDFEYDKLNKKIKGQKGEGHILLIELQDNQDTLFS